jgi:hypothetical protein
MAIAVETEESLAAKFPVLLPHLDERQRRLYLGSEARSLGHGGIEAVARAAGVSRQMVAAGAAELEADGDPLGRARRPGGGRKTLAEADPGLRPALLALVDPGSRGDPESPLRWTTLSLRNLAGELTRQGHRVGPDTVAKLLKEENFSLQGNAKTAEGGRHPDRDAQFRYINARARDHLDAGQPVISVDAKKKQNVGPFKNGGREWRPEGDPEQVNVYDFIDKDKGKVTPYGVYDITANSGWVTTWCTITIDDLGSTGSCWSRSRRLTVGLRELTHDAYCAPPRKRGHRPRHRRVRSADHPHLVAEGRAACPPGCHPAADLRGRRRLQRLPDPAVEDRAGRPR